MNPIRNLFDNVNNTLIDRDTEVRAAVRAAVAHEHLLLVGPPGTAKSMLLYHLADSLGCRAFSYVLNPHTEPEHLFGPESFKARMDDELKQCTDGYAADAELVFMDEIFKASPATRNALLSLMQERTFKNGNKTVTSPLRTLVAASNEIPDNHEDAVYDRFLVRCYVDPVEGDRLDSLLFNEFQKPSQIATLEEWDQAHQEATSLPVSKEAREALMEAMAELQANKIRPGNRRMRKAVNILRAEAWLNGDTEVKPIHLGALADVVWSNPSTRRSAADIVNKHTDPSMAQVVSLEAQLDDITSRDNLEPSDIKKLQRIYESLKKCSKSARQEQATAKAKTAYVTATQKAMGLDSPEEVTALFSS